jgi:hypothetical protein
LSYTSTSQKAASQTALLILGGGAEKQLSVPKMKNMCGIAYSLVYIVGHHNDGNVVAEINELYKIVHLSGSYGVKAGDRLIQKQQLLGSA